MNHGGEAARPADPPRRRRRTWCAALRLLPDLPGRAADAISALTGRILSVWPITSLVLSITIALLLSGVGQLWAPVWPINAENLLYGYKTQGTPMALRETQLRLLERPKVCASAADVCVCRVRLQGEHVNNAQPAGARGERSPWSPRRYGLIDDPINVCPPPGRRRLSGAEPNDDDDNDDEASRAPLPLPLSRRRRLETKASTVTPPLFPSPPRRYWSVGQCNKFEGTTTLEILKVLFVAPLNDPFGALSAPSLRSMCKWELTILSDASGYPEWCEKTPLRTYSRSTEDTFTCVCRRPVSALSLLPTFQDRPHRNVFDCDGMINESSAATLRNDLYSCCALAAAAWREAIGVGSDLGPPFPAACVSINGTMEGTPTVTMEEAELCSYLYDVARLTASSVPNTNDGVVTGTPWSKDFPNVASLQGGARAVRWEMKIRHGEGRKAGQRWFDMLREKQYLPTTTKSGHYVQSFLGPFDVAHMLPPPEHKVGLLDASWNFMSKAYDNEWLKTVLITDLQLAIGACVLIFVAVFVQTGSLFLTVIGVAHVALTAPTAYTIYTMFVAEGGEFFFPVLNFLGVFVILGIGADDLFVYNDTWKASFDILPRESTTLRERITWTHRRAATAMLITSLTTAGAFLSNVFAPVSGMQLFAIYMTILVLVDYIYVITIFPAAIVVRHTCCITRGCCYGRCRCKKRTNDAPIVVNSAAVRGGAGEIEMASIVVGDVAETSEVEAIEGGCKEDGDSVGEAVSETLLHGAESIERGSKGGMKNTPLTVHNSAGLSSSSTGDAAISDNSAPEDDGTASNEPSLPQRIPPAACHLVSKGAAAVDGVEQIDGDSGVEKEVEEERGKIGTTTAALPDGESNASSAASSSPHERTAKRCSHSWCFYLVTNRLFGHVCGTAAIWMRFVAPPLLLVFAAICAWQASTMPPPSMPFTMWPQWHTLYRVANAELELFPLEGNKPILVHVVWGIHASDGGGNHFMKDDPGKQMLNREWNIADPATQKYMLDFSDALLKRADLIDVNKGGERAMSSGLRNFDQWLRAGLVRGRSGTARSSTPSTVDGGSLFGGKVGFRTGALDVPFLMTHAPFQRRCYQSSRNLRIGHRDVTSEHGACTWGGGRTVGDEGDRIEIFVNAQTSAPWGSDVPRRDGWTRVLWCDGPAARFSEWDATPAHVRLLAANASQIRVCLATRVPGAVGVGVSDTVANGFTRCVESAVGSFPIDSLRRGLPFSHDFTSSDASVSLDLVEVYGGAVQNTARNRVYGRAYAGTHCVEHSGDAELTDVDACRAKCVALNCTQVTWKNAKSSTAKRCEVCGGLELPLREVQNYGTASWINPRSNGAWATGVGCHSSACLAATWSWFDPCAANPPCFPPVCADEATCKGRTPTFLTEAFTSCGPLAGPDAWGRPADQSAWALTRNGRPFNRTFICSDGRGLRERVLSGPAFYDCFDEWINDGGSAALDADLRSSPGGGVKGNSGSSRWYITGSAAANDVHIIAESLTFVTTVSGADGSKTPYVKAYWETLEDFMVRFARAHPEAPAAARSAWQSSQTWWGFFDLADAMVMNALTSSGVALALSAVVLLLATGNVRIAIAAACSIAGTIAGVMAFLVWLGWEMNIMESMCMSILAGVSVDFVVHLGHAYNSAHGVLAHDNDEAALEKEQIEEDAIEEEERAALQAVMHVHPHAHHPHVADDADGAREAEGEENESESMRPAQSCWRLFREKEKIRGMRARHALQTIGLSVFSAGVTTALSASLLFACTITFFSKFGTFLVLAMAAALFSSFVGFVPTLALLGPAHGAEAKPTAEAGGVTATPSRAIWRCVTQWW